MPLTLRITAFFMVLILPLLNLFQRADTTDYTYTEAEKPVKQQREYTQYEFGDYDILVSPEGDDSAAGSETAPVKSVERAKALAKERRQSGAQGEITVWIKGGEYLFSSPLEFNSGDARNVRFIACPGEEVVFSGAVKADGWQEDTINGIKCLSATVPDNADFDSVFRDGEKLPQTRYPESGYFYISETNHEGGLFTDENTPWDWSYGDLELTPDKKQETRDFRNPGNVTLRVLHYWADEISKLRGYDEKRGRILFETPASMKIEKGQKYYFENVYEAADKPGEWYFDGGEHKLYYIPREGETSENLNISFGVSEKLVNISGCGSLYFEGITFRDTNSGFPELEPGSWLSEYGMRFPQAEYDCAGAFEVTDCEKIDIKYCSFINIGTCAVKFNRRVKNSSVTGCDILNTGASGVFIHGFNSTQDAEITENITVRDNLIDGYGRYFYAAVGVLLTNARSCEIEHNEIKNGYYTAVSVGWLWGYSYSVTGNISVRDNLIYNIGQGWLSDMGGIYTLGRQRGTVLSGNVIHDVAADSGEGGYGGWGIYLDEGSQFILVEKNLVYSCGSQSFHQHYGENNLIRNNIFALSGEGEARSSFSHGEH
ncbi:MAG: right-handed parallel beta-helix repeat-containing protein, partial [Clostridia bacterium]|nr:right-handed parallel beta-helix repeat-containing protein [Clostridia bacterium]